ncbi:MAG: hypothetical protein AB8G11_19360 [Saprospiraceae bacterium]
MKQIYFFLFGITILMASCQKEALMIDEATSKFIGSYEFEQTCIYPTVGKEIKSVNILELTVSPNTNETREVLIEELGIKAKIVDNKLDIPFQTDDAGQFSYSGYGQKVGDNLQLYLSIQNHTANVIQTCDMKGKTVETLN